MRLLQNIYEIAAGRFHPVGGTVYLCIQITVTEVRQHTNDQSTGTCN